jgi:hypothetical protein
LRGFRTAAAIERGGRAPQGRVHRCRGHAEAL